MFLAMAGIQTGDWADASAAAANDWLKSHNEGLDDDAARLPLLYGVESARGMLEAILSGNQTQLLHPVLQLSANSLLAWPFKLVTGVQPCE